MKLKRQWQQQCTMCVYNVFYINTSRLNQNQGSFVRFGAKLWNSIHDEACYLLKGAFKKHINYNCYKWLIL